MGFIVPEKLSSVDLTYTDASGNDYVKRPFYVVGLDVQHNIRLNPTYYVGGSWPTYSRKVWFQPQSGGGKITLDGFFKNIINYEETYDYLTNSDKINPVSSTPAASLTDLDLRIDGKQYTRCYCVSQSMRSQIVGGNNIIYGTIAYLFSSIADYP